MRLVLANVAIAILLMGMTGLWSVPGFLGGLAVGFVILALVPAGPSSKGSRPTIGYGRRVARLLRLLGMFLRELLLSAFKVARLAVRPELPTNAGLFAYPLIVDRDFEIALLANLITLTPGTLSVDVSDDRRTLYVHAIDCDDTDAARKDIRDGFEKAILEAFR